MDHVPTDTETAPAAETPVASPGPARDVRFSVPLMIEIEETVVPLERLQGITEGAVLPLECGDGTIPVRVLAGGRPLARGTLVSIGQGYGVLIEADSGER